MIRDCLIYADLIESKAVNLLSWEAEVFFRRLWNGVDDRGCADADPALLRSNLYPRQLDRMRETNLERLLRECEQASLVRIVRTESGHAAVMIVNYRQNLKRPRRSKYVHLFEHAELPLGPPGSEEKVEEKGNEVLIHTSAREIGFTLDQVRAAAIPIGLSEAEMQSFHNHFDQQNWLRGNGQLIVKLPPALALWKSKAQEIQNKERKHENKRNSGRRFDRNAGTANEGRPVPGAHRVIRA